MKSVNTHFTAAATVIAAPWNANSAARTSEQLVQLSWTSIASGELESFNSAHGN